MRQVSRKSRHSWLRACQFTLHFVFINDKHQWPNLSTIYTRKSTKHLLGQNLPSIYSKSTKNPHKQNLPSINIKGLIRLLCQFVIYLLRQTLWNIYWDCFGHVLRHILSNSYWDNSLSSMYQYKLSTMYECQSFDLVLKQTKSCNETKGNDEQTITWWNDI